VAWAGSDVGVVLLVVATTLHAGFQLTVTCVVYPALAAVEPGAWSVAHDAHSRAITPVVLLTYAGLLLGVAAALWDRPADLWVWVAVGGVLLTFAATALGAAPTHSKLGREWRADLVRQLILADRIRLVGALVAVLASSAALLT